MKIIDAHLHIFPSSPYTDARARELGHENSVSHLREAYEELGIVCGVVMGNRSLDPSYHTYPSDIFRYCVGLDSSDGGRAFSSPEGLEKIEANLRRDSCCGIKLYPGYSRVWLTDPVYEPVYRLAARYGKPVAVHMGATASPGASLKYCHPLALDEAAADHPDVSFVMCHFGNPFLSSAAAVLEKNENVCADLSGLVEGRIDLEAYLERQSLYVQALKCWLAYAEAWDRVLFGTDWPIVNLGEYIGLIRAIVPEEHWEEVFFENANRVYSLGM